MESQKFLLQLKNMCVLDKDSSDSCCTSLKTWRGNGFQLWQGFYCRNWKGPGRKAFLYPVNTVVLKFWTTTYFFKNLISVVILLFFWFFDNFKNSFIFIRVPFVTWENDQCMYRMQLKTAVVHVHYLKFCFYEIYLMNLKLKSFHAINSV